MYAWNSVLDSTRACSALTPGLRRATMSSHNDTRSRNIAGSESVMGTAMSMGRPGSGDMISDGMTPTIVTVRSVSNIMWTTRPTTAGSPPNRWCQ